MLLQQLRRPRHTDKHIISIRSHSRKKSASALDIFPCNSMTLWESQHLAAQLLAHAARTLQAMRHVRTGNTARLGSSRGRPSPAVQPFNRYSVLAILHHFANLTVCNRSASCSRAGYRRKLNEAESNVNRKIKEKGNF